MWACNYTHISSSGISRASRGTTTNKADIQLSRYTDNDSTRHYVCRKTFLNEKQAHIGTEFQKLIKQDRNNTTMHSLYPVVYVVVLCLIPRNGLSHPICTILAAKRSQSVCQSKDRQFTRCSVVSSNVISSVAHNDWYGSQKPLTILKQIFQQCHLCHFQCVFFVCFLVPSLCTYGVLPYAMINYVQTV